MANNDNHIREINRLLQQREATPGAQLGGCLLGAVILGLFAALVVMAFNFFMWALPGLAIIAGVAILVGFAILVWTKIVEELEKQK